MRDTFGWLLFRVIGNSLKFPITQKGTNVPMMRTRAKQKHVASDRAWRENVPRHILFQYNFQDKLTFKHTPSIMKQADMGSGCRCLCQTSQIARIGRRGQGVKGKQVQNLCDLVTVNRRVALQMPLRK